MPCVSGLKVKDIYVPSDDELLSVTVKQDVALLCANEKEGTCIIQRERGILACKVMY